MHRVLRPYHVVIIVALAGALPAVGAAPEDRVAPSPVAPSPVAASPVVASPVVASPVVASPVVASPVVASHRALSSRGHGLGQALSDTTAGAAPADEAPPRLEVGLFLQVIGKAAGTRYEEPGGFYLDNARITLEGEDRDLAYELEADFSEGAELKDALVSYRMRPALTLTVGHFKLPFSLGELTSSSRTPFVDRARIVRALAPDRHVGVAAAVGAADGGFVLEGGLFDDRVVDAAAEDAPESPRSGLVYALRASWRTPGEAETVLIGANGLYDAADEGDAFRDGLRYGIDGRVRAGAYTVTAEALVDPSPAAGEAASGYYVTAVYEVAARHRLRLRWDGLTTHRVVPDDPADGPPGDLTDEPLGPRNVVGAGYTFLPTAPVRIEVDYLLPVGSEGLQASTVGVNVQLNL